MSEVRKAGMVRTWVGAGMFLVGSLTTVYHAEKSLKLDARGEELELASDELFGLVEDPEIATAVNDHVEKTVGIEVADRLSYRLYTPSEDAGDLANGCKTELQEMDSTQSRIKCNQLGEALVVYRNASDEFDKTMDEMATGRNMVEVVIGGVLIVAGTATGASGIAASNKQD